MTGEPSDGRDHDYERRLLEVTAEQLLPPGALSDPARRDRALDLLRDAYQGLSSPRRRALRTVVSRDPGRPPPGELVQLLHRALGITALHHWARVNRPVELAAMGDRGKVTHWLAEPPFDPTPDLLSAGIRCALGLASAADDALIQATLDPVLRSHPMPPINYDFDPRSRPEGFDTTAQGILTALVESQLSGTVPDDRKDSMRDFVLGALSLDGFLTQDDRSQLRQITQLRFEAEGTTQPVDPGGDPIPNRDAYQAVSDQILAIRAGSGDPLAYYEELAFVSRELISNAVTVPIDANGLRERVTDALNEYVPGQSGGSLTLPPLSAQDGVSDDLVADNIRAVSLVYAAWNLEELKLLPVLDRVTERFFSGLLPIGFDNGGRALSAYYFEDSDQRLNEAARRMTYSRVLGVPGGEVSREAPPNRAFSDTFLRFLASVSEYDRQRRIADVVGNRPRNDVLSVTGEGVRKAGFDLAKNVSLYGYGGTFFVAQRLERQIKQALRILSVPEILAAYGVQGPFQVVERVCATDLGGAVPNIVRFRTMAETGKDILDIIAAHIPAWLGRSGKPLFEDPFVFETGGGSITAGQADIPRNVENKLTRAVEQWLTVNGIKDDLRVRMGEPEATMPAPSIPSVQNGQNAATFDQLRQLVSAGQAPSLDQLKALLPDVSSMVRM